MFYIFFIKNILQGEKKGKFQTSSLGSLPELSLQFLPSHVHTSIRYGFTHWHSIRRKSASWTTKHTLSSTHLTHLTYRKHRVHFNTGHDIYRPSMLAFDVPWLLGFSIWNKLDFHDPASRVPLLGLYHIKQTLILLFGPPSRWERVLEAYIRNKSNGCILSKKTKKQNTHTHKHKKHLFPDVSLSAKGLSLIQKN